MIKFRQGNRETTVSKVRYNGKDVILVEDFHDFVPEDNQVMFLALDQARNLVSMINNVLETEVFDELSCTKY